MIALIQYTAVALFSVAALLSVVKIVRGPSILDRMVGTDVLLSTLLCALGSYVAFTGRTELLPVMMAAASLGFLGSVGVSRYVSRSETSGTIMGPAEAGPREGAYSSDADRPPAEGTAASAEESAKDRKEGEDR